jgi:hypothetical protein
MDGAQRKGEFLVTPQMAILVVPAAAVVAGLVFHSLKLRGKKETIYFFFFALLFGIARGNVIYWITTVHYKGKFPYIFQKRLLGVYHDSLTADFGWIICLYIGSYMAFRIADRLPHIRGRLFPTVSLACLFNVCLSYAVEATAMTMGWWQWNLSTKSSILSDVPMVGIIAWFSVGFDFLIPYYLIRHYRKQGQWWPFLTVLIFPVHMGTHLLHDRVSAIMPITPYNMYHWAMVLAAMILPFACGLRMRVPWLPSGALHPERSPRGSEEGQGRFVRNIPLLGLGVVASVLLFSDFAITGDSRLLISKLPLAVYTLLVIHQIPVALVLIMAGLAAAFGGILLIPPVLMPLFYAALWAKSLWSRMPWLKLVYLLIPLFLTGWYYTWSKARDTLDRRYVALCDEGLALEKTDIDRSIRKFTEAAGLKPYNLRAYQNLGILHSRKKQYGEAERILKKILELRPVSEEAHANLGNVYILKGNLDEAEVWFKKALDINPDHEYSHQMIGEIERLRESARRRNPSGG